MPAHQNERGRLKGTLRVGGPIDGCVVDQRHIRVEAPGAMNSDGSFELHSYRQVSIAVENGRRVQLFLSEKLSLFDALEQVFLGYSETTDVRRNQRPDHAA